MKRLTVLILILGCQYARAQSSRMPGYAQQLEARLRQIDQTIKQGPYQPSSVSLEHYQVSGLVSRREVRNLHSLAPLLGIGIWGRMVSAGKRRVQAPGSRSTGLKLHSDYKDYIPQFMARKFDADRWASLFEDAGAKFVVPVGEHHDGFPMYDSELTEWSAAKRTT